MSATPTIARAADNPRDGWDDARGNVRWTRLFSKGQTATDSLTAGVLVLDPGGFIAPHRHSPAEVYFALEGRGTVVIEGQSHQIERNCGVFVPSDSEHAVRNDGSEPLRLFYVFAVDAISDVTYEFTGDVPSGATSGETPQGTG